LGSGKQFERTWHRDYGSGRSFAGLATSTRIAVWYIPLLASAYGVQRVTPLTIGATIRPAHVIGEEYSANSDVSTVWPDGTADAGRDFVERVSMKAGYNASECWGFHSLGLCVAILDTIPDASLPIFYSRRSGWRPLMARR
jgi:hypothetical protein